MPPPMSYNEARQSGIESSQLLTHNMLPTRRITPPPRNSMRSTSLEPAKLHKPLPDPKGARAASHQWQQSFDSRSAVSAQQSHALVEVPGIEPAKLHKPLPDPKHARAASHQWQHSFESRSAMGAQPSHALLEVPGGPPPLTMGNGHSTGAIHDGRSPVTPNTATSSRPTTPIYSIAPAIPPTPPSSNASDKKKHGWFGRKKEKSEDHTPMAWIAGQPEKPSYDIDGLMRGRIAAELWNNTTGDCYVHLFPPNFDKDASFKVDSSIFRSSDVLSKLVASDAKSTPQRHDAHVYLQLKLSHAAVLHGSSFATSDPTLEDLQILVDYRNLIAFLCGQSLVATEKRSSVFAIFIALSSLLRAYSFSSSDGSSFGEVPDASFDSYIDELDLADIRTSREKTTQGIILGERMRSATLYTESFTHAVGKLDEIVSMKNAKFDMISPTTKTRLNRASLDLEKRIHAAQLTLKDFDFPSIFSGIMNSKTAEERKEGVRFDSWKESFFNTRRWMLGTLKQQYGDWPPKAKSKKNDLEVSGLQRQVLRKLYLDLCSMYDLLVDRTQLTTRTVDGIDRAGPVEAPWIRALRSVLSEYDRSSPPVKPPVPFDLPKLPTLAATRRGFGTNVSADAKAATTKLKEDEIVAILRASWNEDAVVTPFVNAFRDMERRAALGCTMQEMVDLRTGQWIFMYAVMQALPMLACDAPGLRFKKNVDYFLCISPRDGMPWIDPQKATHHKKWFSVGDAGSVVSLPSHVIEHSTEGIYRRSHCWEMAEQWATSNPMLSQALHEQDAFAHHQSPNSLPPPGMHDKRRSPSPARSYRNSSLSLGLEMLSLPPGTVPTEKRRSADVTPIHKVDENKTFDAIFATMETKSTAPRKKQAAVLTK